MPANAIESILQALIGAGVRLVVVGGVAVVLHGHLRLTVDLDLAIALDRENVLSAMRALKSLQFRPYPPVAHEDFADRETRDIWIRDRGMKVFSLWSPLYAGTDVDIFAEEPIPFEEIYARAEHAKLGRVLVPIASIPDLIALKRVAGRPQDLLDISALEEIERSEPNG